MSGVDASEATLAAEPIADDGDPVPELDRLSPRATPRRRATFTAGRRAARRALAQRWGVLPAGLRIDADPAGRPIVSVGGRPSATRISISHVGKWAIAAAAELPIGIDLVELEPLPASMIEEAFAPRELAGFEHALRTQDDARVAPCLAFAAKEAALKWLGVGMAVPLGAVRVTPRGPLEGAFPWRAQALITHTGGRVELPLAAWPIRAQRSDGMPTARRRAAPEGGGVPSRSGATTGIEREVFCVMLGARIAPAQRTPGAS